MTGNGKKKKQVRFARAGYDEAGDEEAEDTLFEKRPARRRAEELEDEGTRSRAEDEVRLVSGGQQCRGMRCCVTTVMCAAFLGLVRGSLFMSSIENITGAGWQDFYSIPVDSSLHLIHAMSRAQPANDPVTPSRSRIVHVWPHHVTPERYGKVMLAMPLFLKTWVAVTQQTCQAWSAQCRKMELELRWHATGKPIRVYGLPIVIATLKGL